MVAEGNPEALTTMSVQMVVFWIVVMSLTTTFNPFTASATFPRSIYAGFQRPVFI